MGLFVGVANSCMYLVLPSLFGWLVVFCVEFCVYLFVEVGHDLSWSSSGSVQRTVPY